MKYDPEKRRSESIRLKGYDYSQPGAYFVTICAHNRASLFGDIVDGKMQLNGYGKIVHEFWDEVPSHFANVKIDTSVVMPNHVHAIIVIYGDEGPADKGERIVDNGEGTSPLRGKRPKLGQIVAYYKYQTTKLINQIRKTGGTPLWQKDYYDHIVRDEDDLNEVREYIIYNPLKWEMDRENPINIKEG
jgi:putative transposase